MNIVRRATDSVVAAKLESRIAVVHKCGNRIAGSICNSQVEIEITVEVSSVNGARKIAYGIIYLHLKCAIAIIQQNRQAILICN